MEDCNVVVGVLNWTYQGLRSSFRRTAVWFSRCIIVGLLTLSNTATHRMMSAIYFEPAEACNRASAGGTAVGYKCLHYIAVESWTTICVCSSHLADHSTPRRPAHPVSVLALHPSEMQALWSLRPSFGCTVSVIPGTSMVTAAKLRVQSVLYLVPGTRYRWDFCKGMMS